MGRFLKTVRRLLSPERLRWVRVFFCFALALTAFAMSVRATRYNMAAVFMFGPSPNIFVYKASVGVVDQKSLTSSACVMKVLVPFDIPPPFIEPRFLCRYRADSAAVDSLCYTDFDCFWVYFERVYLIVATSSFLVGTLLFVAYFARYRYWRKGVRFAYGAFSASVVLIGFLVAKTSDYPHQVMIERLYATIQSINANVAGSLYFEFYFTTAVPEFLDTALFAVLNVCAGVAISVFFDWVTSVDAGVLDPTTAAAASSAVHIARIAASEEIDADPADFEMPRVVD